MINNPDGEIVMATIESTYRDLCIKILEVSLKDYVEKPSERRPISRFAKSSLCEFYCEVADIDAGYYRRLHAVAKETVSSN